MKKLIQIIVLIPWLVQPIFSQDIESQMMPENVQLSFNGIFVRSSPSPTSQANSDNSRFWCRYEIGKVSDEVRELRNFKFFEGDQLQFAMEKAPGSNLYISNSGFIAFMEMSHHYKSELTIHFYSRSGNRLFSETFIGASLFGFSSSGNKFGVGNAKYLKIISIPGHHIETYEGGDQFDISENENLVAIALRDKASVYANSKLMREFKTDFNYSRRIRVSSEHNFLAIIDKKHLKVYSLSDGNVIFEDVLKEKNSFRDLILNEGKILAGIHYQDTGVSKGILKAYDHQGKVLIEKVESSKNFKTFENQNKLQKSSLEYKPIPWPFSPFDSLHTVWNYYEQHMSYGQPGWSYLHQGLDIIVPMNEPTYAVEDGAVKCVLTISGFMHWRIAISEEQSADVSKGWLYAHLIRETIQFDVGDTVQQFDYLGDIIRWEQDWGHIHFVEIQDSGLVWRYDDNEWGITYNPLLSLQPNTDLIPPIIENVFSHSRFGFCLNETSIYLDPDSLYGDIDIIAKITDYIGDSPWQLPAYEIYYWVKKVPEDTIVHPRTSGQILNHPYDFYGADYYTPYATVIYKRDEFLVPPDCMSKRRNYYHVLTNNNGDSLIDLSEKDLAFSTADYPDGEYRIFVEAQDQYGNATVDSMSVKFKNGLSSISKIQNETPLEFQLTQNYPNPFNPATQISYSIPKSGVVKLIIYDLLGRETITLINEFQKAGIYTTMLEAEEFASGIYFYELKLGQFSEVRKMVLMR